MHATSVTYRPRKHVELHHIYCRIIKTNWGDKLAEYTLHIDGMHCGACIRRVTHALASVEGTHVEEVRIGAARISSSTDPVPINLSLEALSKAGFIARLEQ